MISKIIFWIEYPLMHFAPLIKACSLHLKKEVTVVTEYSIPEWRIQMGFGFPDFGKSKVFVSPSQKIRKEIIQKTNNKDSVHIFHGLYKYPKNYRALKDLYPKDCLIGLHLEPMPFSGSVKALCRRFLHKFLISYWHNKTNFLLTHGSLGVEHYTRLGYPSCKTFEFAYFGCELFPTSENQAPNKAKLATWRILYVGQLIKRKNVSLILEALESLQEHLGDWELVIVGDGEEVNNLKQQAAQLGVLEKVFFKGNIPNKEIVRYYENSDFLILPSSYEPWGAVTVEALFSGLPVIVSNNCGSSALAFGKQGLVFTSGNCVSLKRAIKKMVKNLRCTPKEFKAEIKNFAQNCLSAEMGAEYLEQIIALGSPELKAPWRCIKK